MIFRTMPGGEYLFRIVVGGDAGTTTGGCCWGLGGADCCLEGGGGCCFLVSNACFLYYPLPPKMLNLIVFSGQYRFAFLMWKSQSRCYKNRSGLRSRPNLVLLTSLVGSP